MTSIFAHHPLPHLHHPYRLLIIGLLLLACLLIGKAAAGQAEDVTPAGQSEGVLVLASDFELKQYTAQGILESKPEESQVACRVLRQALSAAAENHPDLRVVPLPGLDSSEQAAVDEHVALLSTIIDNIRFMEEKDAAGFSRQSALGPAAMVSRDYSIGAGLEFLAERTGAREALIVTGWHVAPTGGRVALGILLYGMPPPEAGILSVAMAELETGRVTWFRSTREVYDGISYAILGQGRTVDDKIVTDSSRSEALFREMLASYHGLEESP